MKCPRCNRTIKAYYGITGGGERSITRRRACPNGHMINTVEKIVYHVDAPMPRSRLRDAGVRFDIVVGDDEPGARR